MDTNDYTDPDEIRTQPLTRGLTREADICGIPIGPVIFAACGVMIVFIVARNPLYLGLGIPVYLILRYLSADNPRVFDEAAAWMRVNMRCRNRRYWGMASFSPRRFKKSKGR